MEFDADHLLCINCGFISRLEQWTFWTYADKGVRVPAPQGKHDIHMLCPVCRYFHVDDGGPGIFSGPYYACEIERQTAEPAFADQWSEVAEKVFGL